eukprot:5937386-Amphidinium_carterae.1
MKPSPTVHSRDGVSAAVSRVSHKVFVVHQDLVLHNVLVARGHLSLITHWTLSQKDVVQCGTSRKLWQK